MIKLALLLLLAFPALAVEHRRPESPQERRPQPAAERPRHVEVPAPKPPPPLCVRHPRRCSLPALLDMGGGREEPGNDNDLGTVGD